MQNSKLDKEIKELKELKEINEADLKTLSSLISLKSLISLSPHLCSTGYIFVTRPIKTYGTYKTYGSL